MRSIEEYFDNVVEVVYRKKLKDFEIGIVILDEEDYGEVVAILYVHAAKLRIAFPFRAGDEIIVPDLYHIPGYIKRRLPQAYQKLDERRIIRTVSRFRKRNG